MLRAEGLSSFKLGQIGRSCSIVRIKKARVRGAYVRLIGSFELGSGDPHRELKTSREMEIGTGDSGQPMHRSG